MNGVRLLTRDAARADELSEQDYRDIYEELRKGKSLRAFVELLASQFSIAYWSKVERGEAELNREARQELRRAVGLAALPATVGECLAEVDPDATVWQVGDGTPDRVVLVGSEAHEPITLRLNGSLSVEEAVTPVTGERQGTRKGRERGSIVVGREFRQRLNEVRGERTWEEFLGTLLTNECTSRD